MSKKQESTIKGLRVFPPAPEGFDALTATKRDLIRHGLPERPDVRAQPGMAALWERHARRYRDFQHLPAAPSLVDAPVKSTGGVLPIGLYPGEHCGYELGSDDPFVLLSGTWTVPNLSYRPAQLPPVRFRTFFSLGFLDVHVEMTVDIAGNVTAAIGIAGAQVALPVRAGDAITATLCLQPTPLGTAFYGLANETTSQTVNVTWDSHYPPAVTIAAGISRGDARYPFNPLAGFGVVYFDEIAAFTTNGTRHITDGVATSMVDSNGATLAVPIKLNDYAFKIVRQGD